MALIRSIPIEHPTQAGEARREAAVVARERGLDDQQVARAALVATEAARNVVKHAATGEILLLPSEAGDAPALGILALDKGPGMADVARCLGDGFSTAGTPGTGLGAIQRACEEFDLYSAPGHGTALWAWVGPPAGGRMAVGAVVKPHPGEEVSGDALLLDQHDDQVLVAVLDGLGHGPEARRAALAGIGILERHAERSPGVLLGIAHDALRSTRGAAVAIARIDLSRGTLRYAGVGNISGLLVGPGGLRSLLSHPGTVGHEARKIQELEYPWAGGSLLIMHSDGIATHWRLDQYPGLAAAHPAVIAGVLQRDFRRQRDDASVVVLRERTA